MIGWYRRFLADLANISYPLSGCSFSMFWKFEKSELPDFKIVNKYIYFRTDCDSDAWKLYVPEELRNQIMNYSHDSPNSSHSGIAKTLERVRRFFYWPGLVGSIRQYVLNCELCKTSKPPTHGSNYWIPTTISTTLLWFNWTFSKIEKGNIGSFIILDHFSKFTFLFPLKNLLQNLL